MVEIGRDEAMQLWVLGWMLVGSILMYAVYKGQKGEAITGKGLGKNIGYGIVAWGLVLGGKVAAFSDVAWGSIRHVDVVIPAIIAGAGASVIVGVFIKRNLEGLLAGIGGDDGNATIKIVTTEKEAVVVEKVPKKKKSA